VDVLGAAIVSAQPGSGTFIASLVNGSPDEDTALNLLAGVGDGAVAVEDFTDIEVPARGIVNLAETEGLPVSGEFEAGQFVDVQIGLSTGETVTMTIPVVPDAGYFTGLDTSSA
jgi:hypothetical protein